MTAASAAQPVTGKQVSFMGTLIAERSDDNVAKAFAAAGIDQTTFSPTDCSKGEASALISALLDTPKMKKGQKAAAPVSTASAQIAFGSDVPPAATVTKSLVGLACADVDYQVKVTNTSTAESLKLTALTDSGFGSITSVHDAVLSTTCSVPQDIAKGANYQCGFRAHFCGDSHTNTVTAKLRDNENPNTDVSFPSDPLTVDVGAVQVP